MYNLYILLSAVSAVLYTYLIIWFITGWKQLKPFKSTKAGLNTKVTVILPVYNASRHIEQTLNSLVAQRINVPEYEILVIDDYSTDASFEIAHKYAQIYNRIRVIKNTSEKGKKQALLQAIAQAKGELIVTTDSDCQHSKDWLHTMVEFYEVHQSNLIIGPIALPDSEDKFEKFQHIEMVALSASAASTASIGHATMSSAANMAFKKAAFNTLTDPFNNQYISGDDMFLLHKMKEIDPFAVHFIKAEEAIVYTKPESTFKRFAAQRVRWISKTKGYTDNDTKFTAIIVAASATLIILGFLIMPFKLRTWKPLLFLYTVKTIADMGFLFLVSPFYKVKENLKWIPLFEFWYSAYVSYTLIASFKKRKKW